MDERDVRRGFKYFKENTNKIFELFELESFIASGKEILGEDIHRRVFNFYANFFHLNSECNLIKWFGSSGTGINFSAFFLNNQGSGYNYFRTMYPEGHEFVLGLSDDIVDLLEILLRIKEVSDRSNPVPEERRIKRLVGIKNEIEECLSRLEKNLTGIVKTLWPDTYPIEDKGDSLLNILSPKNGIKKNSVLLDVIKSLDLKDLQIQEDLDALKKKDSDIEDLKRRLIEKEKEEQATKIEDLKDTIAGTTSEDFLKAYRIVFNELKEEIYYRLEDSLYKKIKNNIFHLRTKIFLLRAITYAVPLSLLIYHFFNKDQNFYLYLTSITILALSFQQLRVAVKEISIKKNLLEIYRHRCLVAGNFERMYVMVEGEAKNEVIKSASKSLFENEPSTYEKSQSTPPHVGDIKNFISR